MSDGKPIPPDMRMTLSSEFDAQVTTLPPDGSFEFTGLAKGVYVLIPDVRGYRSADGDTSEVLVERDRKDVVIQVEPRSRR